METYVDPSRVGPAILKAAQDYSRQHTAGGLRGDSVMPHAPFPSPENSMLRYLIDGAEAMLADGVDPAVVVHQAIVHAWFEGHIEGREAAHQRR